MSWAERQRRYEATEKARMRMRRYEQSEKGQARRRRRLQHGGRYFGKAATVAEADRINSHIKERLSEFVTRQSAGAEAQSDPAGAVPAETGDREDRF